MRRKYHLSVLVFMMLPVGHSAAVLPALRVLFEVSDVRLTIFVVCHILFAFVKDRILTEATLPFTMISGRISGFL
jgi:hypothetical protein